MTTTNTSQHFSESNDVSNENTILNDINFSDSSPSLSPSSSTSDYSTDYSNSNDIENKQLESVINNYNRICSQLPQNSSNNWLHSFFDLMRTEWTRLRTFYARQHSKWTLEFVTPEELANAGFFFLNGDRVQCAFCRGIVSGWETGDRPLAEHARHFPRCPFIMEEDVGNVPIGLDPIRGPKQRIGYDVCGNMPFPYNPVLNSIAVQNRNSMPIDMREYGVQPHSGPKNPSFKSIDARKASFHNNCWSSSVPVSTDTLAEAGFFSIGMDDYVKCFYCDGGLRDWDLGDDPWVEHAKWFPDCQFVQLNKSEAFVDECKRLAQNENGNQSNSESYSHSDPEVFSSSGSDSDEEDIDALGVHAVNEWLNTDIVLQLIDLNTFSIDLIKAVLNRRWHQERQPFSSFSDLYDAVSQWRPQSYGQISQSLAEVENNLNTLNEDNTSGADVLPSSQSSISSTTSSLSTYSYSSSPVESSESITKSEDNRLLCKICLDREIGVVFLPCGHQLACTQCAPCVTDCPICRKVIRGTVRTFFS